MEEHGCSGSESEGLNNNEMDRFARGQATVRYDYKRGKNIQMFRNGNLLEHGKLSASQQVHMHP